jgi:putative Holliday junction resolvase
MRYVGIDLGDKRTGVAVGDSLLRMASPVGVVEVPAARREGAALIEALDAQVAAQVGPAGRGDGELVVGLPLNMDGTEGPRARLARGLATMLGERTGRTIHLFDERLTSSAADWAMARSGLTRGQKKARRDALAAAAMLQGFLDALPPSAPRPLR